MSFELRNLIQPLSQFDVRAPRIGDERDRDAERVDFRVRPIELDALRFKLLAELREVLHLEPDVIDDTTARTDDRFR